MRLAVIPARGGSKRIPRKNARLFCGRPMLQWSIIAAQQSGCFDRIVVSTDDEQIATLARELGADVPFLRDASLADDHTGTLPVVADTIRQLQRVGDNYDAVCCIYATAPFVQPHYLQAGMNALLDNDCDYAFSVTSFGFPVQRAIGITDDERIEMMYPEHMQTRSQDLREYFHDAGQFYWGRPQAWLDGTALFSKAAVPVVLPRHLVQDIDTPEDWERAEWMFKAMLLENS